ATRAPAMPPPSMMKSRRSRAYSGRWSRGRGGLLGGERVATRPTPFSPAGRGRGGGGGGRGGARPAAGRRQHGHRRCRRRRQRGAGGGLLRAGAGSTGCAGFAGLPPAGTSLPTGMSPGGGPFGSLLTGLISSSAGQTPPRLSDGRAVINQLIPASRRP